MPQLITPPLDGIGLNVPGYDAEPFRSTRILLSLNEADVEAAVRDWQQERFPNPNEHAEVIPYTPNAQDLLSSLSAQAQLFLLLALLAATLSVWSIVGGFLALLDVERFRIALDRAFGLSLKGLTYAWWWRTFGLGVVSAGLGVGLAHELAVRLYNAFALDVPNLPVQHDMTLNLPLLGGLAITLLLLSIALTRLARTRLERRSTLQLLKEGAL
jgi:ABC-type lipoprotein release transport system permease subunit